MPNSTPLEMYKHVIVNKPKWSKSVMTWNHAYTSKYIHVNIVVIPVLSIKCTIQFVMTLWKIKQLACWTKYKCRDKLHLTDNIIRVYEPKWLYWATLINKLELMQSLLSPSWWIIYITPKPPNKKNVHLSGLCEQGVYVGSCIPAQRHEKYELHAYTNMDEFSHPCVTIPWYLSIWADWLNLGHTVDHMLYS